MAIGLVGRKCGMTRIFTEDGVSVPVTVIEVEPNRITQVKAVETDGYSAVQVTTGSRKASRVGKPAAGHFAKAEAEAGRGLWEFRLTEEEVAGYKVGDAIEVNVFEAGAMVDVTGTSKGKGFAGTIKRWNFKGQDATHGNSLSHRVPGSIGQNQTPGRVFKGKRWLVTWVIARQPFNPSRLFVLMPKEIFFWLRARFRVLLATMLSSSQLLKVKPKRISG